MKRLPWLWPSVIVFSAAGVGLAVFGDIVSPIRPLIALWFLIVCPGMAYVRLLRIREVEIELTLAIALSLAIDALVAGIMLYAGIWSPNWGLGGLIFISLVGVAFQIIAPNRELSLRQTVSEEFGRSVE